MVDFRRMIPVLAVIAFLLGSAVTASAQSGVISPTMTCLANGGVAVPARSEGLTELGGDLVVTCTGGTPTAFGAAIPQVNVQIFLNTALTSRLLTSSSTGTQWSEALLMLDEPAVGAQFGCTGNNGVCANVGNGAGAPIYGPGPASLTNPSPATNKNIFQGIQTTSNSVTFLGVPIDPPGTTNARYIRITNVRGNANALGVAGANSTPTPIVETISTTPPQFLPVSNPSQTIAFIQRGLLFSLVKANGDAATATNAQQCNSRTATGSGATALLFLRYQEQFGTAFKKRFNTDNSTSNQSGTAGTNGATPQQNQLTGASAIGGAAGTYNTESGFVSTSVLLPSGTQTSAPGTTAGLADWGTRVKAVFNNVPNGVSLFVDTVKGFNCSGLLGAIPAGQACSDTFVLTASETGSFSAVGSTSGSPNGGLSSQLTVTNGTATAVWEDLESDANTFADVRFGVYATFTASPGTNSPALATGTVNGSFAPTSTITIASNANVPRFADTSTATNIFTIVPCLTTLLFPYVTSQAGFDTGIAISATATDPFGTTPQSGTCTLNWFGAAFTGATPTPNVPSGTTYATLVSTTLNNVTGGFGGYMIAVCRFQYAHGFAFISDLGARNLAMGYLALVIPDPTVSGRAPTDPSFGPTTGGEQLNQ